MVGLAAIELTRSASWVKPGWRNKPPCPVLFLLDEFPILGLMTPISNGLSYLAGYDVQIWTFAQNIGQLKDIYGESWHNFPANAGATSFFGVNDPDTAEYVERLLGEGVEQLEYYEHATAQKTTNLASNVDAVIAHEPLAQFQSQLDAKLNTSDSSGIAKGHRFKKEKLASASEIRALPEPLELVFIRNQPPILAIKMPYYKFNLLHGLVGTWQR